ncbi:MAG: uL30 family ribosomal protein [Candidatus Bathyarchaeota archaeon]|nr:uL30 family ribosomal protein [Candidatus Bathyarchaeota archaeon]
MSEKTTIVIRIRGGIDCPHFVKDTMKMLRVDRTNCATILRETPSYLGMLRKAKDYITWGEVSVETIKLPKKGFKRTVKRPFRDKGELGNRGEAIDELVKRMC